jgi:hypothetical protein
MGKMVTWGVKLLGLGWLAFTIFTEARNLPFFFSLSGSLWFLLLLLLLEKEILFFFSLVVRVLASRQS